MTLKAELRAAALAAALSASVFAGPCLSACAGKSTSREHGHYRIDRVLHPTIHVRRPPSPPANPGAFIEEPDYRSHPAPDERFDCQPLHSLIDGFDLKRIRECFLSIAPGTELKYELDTGHPPSWRLKPAKNAPECLPASLTQLPVPREIVFQSTQRTASNRRRYDCYASRLDTGKPLALRIEFPLKSPLETDEQVRATLESWVLTPFWREDPDGSRAVSSRLMADPICARCMTPGTMMQPWMTPPPEPERQSETETAEPPLPIE